LNLKGSGIGIAKGMLVTIKYLFKKPVTTQYPEQRLNVSKRIRGNELIWDRDKCTACSTCAKTCPQGAIKIVTAYDDKAKKYVMQKMELDTGYCIGCGLCIEVCPYNALFMGTAYERAKYRRADLIQSDDMMLESAERQPSAYAHPEKAAALPEQTLLVEGKLNNK